MISFKGTGSGIQGVRFPGNNGEFWNDTMNLIDVVSVLPFYVRKNVCSEQR